MIARHFLPRAQAPEANPLDRLERLLGRRAGDGYVDYPAMADRRSSLAESLSALGLFSVLIAMLTAGSVIGRGFAYSDVVVLLAIQTATAVTVWRFGWQRVSEPWLLAVVGAQAVFVASLITLTGGPASPYFALYAPVLALAGWHLRPVHAGIAVAFVAGIELWRVLVVEVSSSFDHLAVALPAFALLALLAGMTSRRLTAAVVMNRRDQVRTAATLRVMRRVRDDGPDQPIDPASALGEVFSAEATIAAFEGDPDERGCQRVGSRHGHIAVSVAAAGSGTGRIRLCRPEPFSASERRLAAILADALGNQHEHRRLFEEVRTDARRDHLTGLLNRAAFEQDVQQAVDGARADGSSLSLCLLKVDGFAEIVDKFGRSQADAVLQRLALMLLAQAGVTDRVYRFETDEFAVLAPDDAQEGAAERGALIRRMAGRALFHAVHEDGRSLASVSIGIAACRAGDCEAASMVTAAQVALAIGRQPEDGD
jgi:diguanylate cyclase (GGDEF)-like protein